MTAATLLGRDVYNAPIEVAGFPSMLLVRPLPGEVLIWVDFHPR